MTYFLSRPCQKRFTHSDRKIIVFCPSSSFVSAIEDFIKKNNIIFDVSIIREKIFITSVHLTSSFYAMNKL